MIRVDRSPCPHVLQSKGAQWLAELKSARNERMAILNDPTATDEAKRQAEKRFKSAQSKYNCASIKTILETMFNGGIQAKSTKCAYCETNIESPKGQDIEHFYPKSRYPEKTFEWENLLIACQTCNEEFKLDEFPTDANGNPLLINPTTTDPAEHLDFIFDAATLDAYIEGKDEIGRVTVDFFALNGSRASDGKTRNLAQSRGTAVKGWIAMAVLIQRETNPEKAQNFREQLSQLCNAKTPYAAFARSIYAALEM